VIPQLRESVRAFLTDPENTATKLASRSGMPPGRLGLFLAGNNDLTLDHFIRLCSTVGLFLAGGHRPQPPEQVQRRRRKLSRDADEEDDQDEAVSRRPAGDPPSEEPAP
jgi:hypothetical protein